MWSEGQGISRYTMTYITRLTNKIAKVFLFILQLNRSHTKISVSRSLLHTCTHMYYYSITYVHVCVCGVPVLLFCWIVSLTVASSLFRVVHHKLSIGCLPLKGRVVLIICCTHCNNELWDLNWTLLNKEKNGVNKKINERIRVKIYTRVSYSKFS